MQYSNTNTLRNCVRFSPQFILKCRHQHLKCISENKLSHNILMKIQMLMKKLNQYLKLDKSGRTYLIFWGQLQLKIHLLKKKDQKLNNSPDQINLQESNTKSQFKQEQNQQSCIGDPFAKPPQQSSLQAFIKKDSNAQQQQQKIPVVTKKEEIEEQKDTTGYDQFIDEYEKELNYTDPEIGFQTRLYPYQQQALTWLLQRERGQIDTRTSEGQRQLHPLWRQYKTKDEQVNFYFNAFSGQLALKEPKSTQECRGGILADEMGLGKTVMFLALIHSNQQAPTGTREFRDRKSLKRNLLKDYFPHSGKQAKTLIILPLTLVSQWESEIKIHSAKQTSVFVYYGKDKGKVELSNFDVVLTTYGCVRHEFFAKQKQQFSLFDYFWMRVILDEAHYIKGRVVKMAQAIYELKAHYRWCSTGTPIQNKIDELFSLIHFIKLEPWSEYLWWKEYITKPLESGDQKVFSILRTIVRPVLLRRTKQTRDANGELVIKLPPKHIHLHELEMSEEEQKIYQRMDEKSKEEVGGYISKGILMSQYMKIFELILRLRQLCDHPFLIYSRSTDIKNADQLEEALKKLYTERHTANQEENDESDSEQHKKQIQDDKYFGKLVEKLKAGEMGDCPVCLEPVEDPCVTSCLHLICRLCLLGVLQNLGTCPTCRHIVTKEDYIAVPRDTFFALDWKEMYKRSTKIEKLMQIVDEIISKQEKVVIFTQFIGMMELLMHDFQNNQKIKKILKLDGKMNQQNRTKTIQQFKEDPDALIFLISLKAGGVGLNLTAANHVVLIDPWWNPAVEDQAIERIYRIGQEKEVHVHRLILKDTIEQRIIQLHQIKQQLFNSTISEDERKEKRIKMMKNLIMGSG